MYDYLKKNVKVLCLETPKFGVLKKGEIYIGDLVMTKNKISPKRYILLGKPGYAFQFERFQELPSILNINSKTI
jgi:hypothetical protein